MSLVRAELRRLFKRRLALWMLILVLGLFATVAVVMASTHYSPGPEALARAQASAAEEFEQQQEWIERDIAQCEEAAEAGDAGPRNWPDDCEQIHDWYASEEQMVDWFMPPTFEFREDFGSMITVFAVMMAMFAFTVGASFVGAEWRTGGMMNLLLWRPRRLSVLGGKLVALGGVLAGLTVLLGGLWTGGFWLIAMFRGVTDTMTSGAWQSVGLSGLRALALVLVAGVIGFSLASLGRHTAAALGTATAAVVVGIAGVSMVAGVVLELQFWQRWMWTTYLQAWLDGSVLITDWGGGCVGFDDDGSCVQPTLEIGWQLSGLGIAVVVALVLGAALWRMRRRDVT
ncbi:ABC transporter permease subunit [Natronosporangium hydrolyticum]|uniref:ABC transporter permease subunit n=1 Tax=Natronosporangium hydrolyticum TaxID=2811111 RepID=A0A895YHU0_9ACTN|nr:ABC transporter permease subunit [Natronosporangium hydrolyticum]QSB15089.1 ABC transporter permease subunit [Natronosporangium hydrolyticum]